MNNLNEDVLKNKSLLFAIRIINLYKFLRKKHSEFTLSKQILRSGTSIGAMVREAEYAQSTKDFVHKFSISLKEANETDYWLELLFETNFITGKMYESLKFDCVELLKILTATIKTSKLRL